MEDEEVIEDAPVEDGDVMPDDEHENAEILDSEMKELKEDLGGNYNFEPCLNYFFGVVDFEDEDDGLHDDYDDDRWEDEDDWDAMDDDYDDYGDYNQKKNYGF